ncbi:hypothetical protein NDU88_004979 [Pleurodeles waltl]|uniref:Uncharacterized protein n=1 Tax=Pleurodeles waltl TaxID=8319 RepID=A0AAV7SKC0_PLEWA|nr:hypothetical protein NDU88_004979 [Pleurodeles waltl]
MQSTLASEMNSVFVAEEMHKTLNNKLGAIEDSKLLRWACYALIIRSFKIRSRARQTRLTKPTPIQSEEGKLLAFHAVSPLTETNVLDKEEERSDAGHVTDARLSYSDSQAGTPEGCPHVMPQLSKDIT